MISIQDDFFDIETLQESFDIEFKKALGRDGKGKIPEDIWESYPSMANTEGGYIFLGIEEKKPNLYLHSILDPSKLKKELLDTLNNPTKVNINLLQNEDIQDLEIQGKTLIRIHVPRATRKQRPVYIGSNPLTGTYIRKHESDYLCSAEHVKQMLGEQAQDTRDAVLLSGFSFEEDVEKESFRIYRQNFQNRKPEHPFNECDDREF